MTPSNKISLDEFERVERYILGEMLAEEKRSFENEMNENPSLKDVVEENRLLIQTIETGALREKLEHIHQKKFGSKPMRKSIITWFAVAAGIAFLIAVGISIIELGSVEEKIFAEYTTTDPGQPVPMSSTDSDYMFQDAMVDYKAGKFDRAINKWSGILTEDPESNILNYYIGSAYFNLEKYSRAVQFFEIAANQETQEFSAKAQWYLILSQLKLKDPESILSTIPIPGSPYSEQIKDIQLKLKK